VAADVVFVPYCLDEFHRPLLGGTKNKEREKREERKNERKKRNVPKGLEKNTFRNKFLVTAFDITNVRINLS